MSKTKKFNLAYCAALTVFSVSFLLLFVGYPWLLVGSAIVSSLILATFELLKPFATVWFDAEDIPRSTAYTPHGCGAPDSCCLYTRTGRCCRCRTSYCPWRFRKSGNGKSREFLALDVYKLTDGEKESMKAGDILYLMYWIDLDRDVNLRHSFFGQYN